MIPPIYPAYAYSAGILPALESEGATGARNAGRSLLVAWFSVARFDKLVSIKATSALN